VTAIAIQYGIPVVASAVGGLVEYFKGNSLGRLCPPNDPSALSEAILSQLSAPLLQPEEVKAVQDRFSWDAFSKMALKNV
jgi:glycosyltransferase involved in cell wall biosynthesis